MGNYQNSIYMSNEIEMINDVNKLAGFDVQDCPRFRKCEIDMTKPQLCIRGRCGGGNREDYEDEIKYMENQNGFISSNDMEFDQTYMYFEYNLPEKEWLEFIEKYKDHN